MDVKPSRSFLSVGGHAAEFSNIFKTACSAAIWSNISKSLGSTRAKTSFYQVRSLSVWDTTETHKHLSVKQKRPAYRPPFAP